MTCPSEPTAEECNNRTELPDFNDKKCFAYWYPQMGGYSSKSVVCIDKDEKCSDCCFNVFVWHDGEFPFCGSEHHPTEVHHCMPSQFIDFGNFVMQMQKELAEKQ